jgi:two-component system response regulator (stage 0 sporulation protein A)
MEKIKILLCDDNEQFCNEFTKYLNSLDDMEVVGVTSNSLDAIRLINDTQCDILIMDMIMPHIDGIGILERIQAMNKTLVPRIIMLTAVGNDYVMNKALSLGADYCLLKPCNFELAVNRIREVSDKERLLSFSSPSSQLSVSDNVNLEMEVGNILYSLGMPSHIRGFIYLREAIIMNIRDMNFIKGITITVYPTIAKKHSTRPSCVERAMRHAIEVVWNRGNFETINSLFGYTIKDDKGKPTNSEFIAMLSDKMRVKLRAS